MLILTDRNINLPEFVCSFSFEQMTFSDQPQFVFSRPPFHHHRRRKTKVSLRQLLFQVSFSNKAFTKSDRLLKLTLQFHC